MFAYSQRARKSEAIISINPTVTPISVGYEMPAAGRAASPVGVGEILANCDMDEVEVGVGVGVGVAVLEGEVGVGVGVFVGVGVKVGVGVGVEEDFIFKET
jgi:hypothetical protein